MGQKMGFVLASENDNGLTDEEQDEYLQLEREIGEEHQAERFASLYGLIDRLAKTHHQYAHALRIAAATYDLPDVADCGETERQPTAGKALTVAWHGVAMELGTSQGSEVTAV
jgi:hypothetical protein